MLLRQPLPLLWLALAQFAAASPPPAPCNDVFCHGGNDGCSGNLCEGDGDCDKDEDCAGALLCGTDNCKAFRDSSAWDKTCDAPGWDATDDCCYMPGGIGSPSTFQIQEQCQGGNDGCQTAGRLQLGDGDCDNDAECAEGLSCGTDNCGIFRDTNGWSCDSKNGFDLTDDCCFKPGGEGDPNHLLPIKPSAGSECSCPACHSECQPCVVNTQEGTATAIAVVSSLLCAALGVAAGVAGRIQWEKRYGARKPLLSSSSVPPLSVPLQN
jgi:hypothetical protein